MRKKLDMAKLTVAIRDAHLEECLSDKCQCITFAEHEKNLQKAIKLGMYLGQGVDHAADSK